MQRRTYDEIAEWYDDQVLTNGFFQYVFPSLYEFIGDVQGQRVCDLACGQGVVARRLAELGAFVTGIDISGRLLEIARQKENGYSQNILYVQDDAQVGTTLADERFDGVVCNLALMDIPDLPATLRMVSRILRPGGWFVFSITHPFSQMPDADWVTRADGTMGRMSGDYFAEGFWLPANAPGVRGRVGAHHRMLSTYLNGVMQVGLRIEQLTEPRASGDAIHMRHAAYLKLPPVLVVRCLKV
jgi:ubiquinone/menaquinone biosynthesis C-methylase UbiE